MSASPDVNTGQLMSRESRRSQEKYLRGELVTKTWLETFCFFVVNLFFTLSKQLAVKAFKQRLKCFHVDLGLYFMRF